MEANTDATTHLTNNFLSGTMLSVDNKLNSVVLSPK